MKIACCLFKYFPYGGLALDFSKIAKELVSRGHEVYAFVLKWDGEKIPNVQVTVFNCNSLTNHGAAAQYVRKLEQVLQKSPFDVVLGFNRMPSLQYYYAADSCFLDKYAQRKKTLKKFLYSLTPRYKTFSLFEEAVFGSTSKTKIFFLDPTQKKIYGKYYPSSLNRCFDLPPGISPEFDWHKFTTQEILSYRHSLHISDESCFILQVGSDFKRKGVDRSLKAIASLPTSLRDSIRFTVIGQDNAEPFLEMAQELGIARQVCFAGAKQNLAIDMAAADIFLHPAYSENTGTVILEALSMGTPSIVSGVCGYAHYVKDAQAGFVTSEKFDQQEFNDYLRELVRKKNLRNLFSGRAKKYTEVHDFLSMPKYVAEILERDFLEKK